MRSWRASIFNDRTRGGALNRDGAPSPGSGQNSLSSTRCAGARRSAAGGFSAMFHEWRSQQGREGGTPARPFLLRGFVPWLVGLVLLPLITGCGTVGYYAQAIHGQCQILHREVSVQKLLADPTTPEPLKGRLNQALAIRDFAEKQLRLPADGHYRHYADLGRRYAVWTVYAAREFSLEAKTWWYPVVGRLEYQGYFDEAKARRCAQRLGERGLDTHVGGVEAYSTLGWFRDPLLNTFLFEDDVVLAELLFHELAHQRVFVPGDTDFNEAFATAVAEEGVERWLRSRGDEALIARQRGAAGRKQVFLGLVGAARARLEGLYGSASPTGCVCACGRGEEKQKRCTSPRPSPPSDGGEGEGGTLAHGHGAADCPCARLRRAKAGVFEGLRADYAAAKADWGGDGEYDGWFGQPLNNALLNTVDTYHSLVPAFRGMLEAEGGDLEGFFRRTADLGKLTREERHGRLRAGRP